MQLNEYQRKTSETAAYEAIGGHGFLYPLLGLCNEAGEVAGKVKKIFRDKGGVISADDKAALRDELGDVLWYLGQTALQFGLTLDEIAERNVQKLEDRKSRGVIQGSGDNR